MAENPPNLQEWQQKLELASFIDTRKGDITQGTQFAVYTRTDLDFVVKIPKNDIWLEGYTTANGEEFTGFVVPFLIEDDITLKINHQRKRFGTAIVQQKVPNTQSELNKAVDSRDWNQFEKLIRMSAQLDRASFNKGLYSPDPAFQNFGVMPDGSIRWIDAGSFRQSFADSLVYTSMVNARAITHQAMYMGIKGMTKDRKFENGSTGSEIYRIALGLEIPQIPRVTLDNLERIRFEETTSLLLSAMGDDEFRLYAPDGAPFDIDVNHPSELIALHLMNELTLS